VTSPGQTVQYQGWYGMSIIGHWRPLSVILTNHSRVLEWQKYTIPPLAYSGFSAYSADQSAAFHPYCISAVMTVLYFVLGETQSVQDAMETAAKKCSEQKQALDDTVSQLSERVKQLEDELLDEKQRTTDEQFTGRRLRQQLQQQKQELQQQLQQQQQLFHQQQLFQQQLEQQASERAAQCPDRQPSQSSPLFQSSPTTSESGFSRSDVTGPQQKDRDALPLGAKMRRMDGRVDETNSEQMQLVALQPRNRTKVDQEGFSRGRDGQSAPPENIPGYYSHENPRRIVSQPVIQAEHDDGSIRHGSSVSPESGGEWKNQPQQPESSYQHAGDAVQNPQQLLQSPMRSYEHLPESRSTDQLVVPKDNSSRIMSDALFHRQMRSRLQSTDDEYSPSQGFPRQNGESMAQPVNVDVANRKERSIMQDTEGDPLSAQNQRPAILT